MLKSGFLLLLLFLATVLSVAQELRHPVVAFSHPHISKINSLVDARKYKAAIDLSIARAEERKTAADWEGYIFFLLRAAEIETFEVWKGKGFPGSELYPDYKRPLKYLQQLNQNAGRFLELYPYLKANTLYTNAVVYHWLDMPDTAEVLHNQALDLRKKIYGESSREVADSYLWRGVLYNWGLHRKDLAEPDYNRAWELQKQFMPVSRYALGSVYYGLANIAMGNFQFDEALTLANQYLILYHDIPYEQAFGLQLIANIYWNKGDFEKSLENRRQTISIYERSDFKEDLIIEYSNLAMDLLNLRRYADAKQALKKGEQILNTGETQDPYYAKVLLENFGDLHRKMRNYDSARIYLDMAMDIAAKQYGNRNEKVADIHRLRGQMFKEQMQFENALQDYQKMLIAVIPEFSSADYAVNPPVQHENPYFVNIIIAWFRKGDAYLAWYDKTADTRHLASALENYRLAYHQIMVARQSIGDELSKPFLISNFQQSIENSLRCAGLLYGKEKNNEIIDDIVYFIELTKYLNVLDALERSERANNSDVPVELLFELKAVRNELNELQRIELQSTHLALSADSLVKVRDRILELIQVRRKIMSDIEHHSGHALPDVDSRIIGMTDIRKQLYSDEQILEFFWGKDTIYVLSITQTSADIGTIANDIRIDSIFLSIQRIFSDRPSYNTADVDNYSLLASEIYGEILQPFVKKKKLVIIPDGPLNHIPVEALVLRHQPGNISFRDLEYMVYDYQISYAYSSSILFHHDRNDHATIEKVLAFSYSGERDLTGQWQNQQIALPGALRELKVLSGIFKNVLTFTDKHAVKKNFLGYAKDHDLIHLGVHGIGDPEIADNSRLIFRSDSAATADLYAYEIYNLDIDASLVVLSACETGIGKRQSGEGIFSIARAFSYAGCPSALMSMWRVNDKFTASIMEGFYKNLHRGESLSASLQESKKEFLKASDEFSSHPANWSAFVLNGQDKSFETKFNTATLSWILIASGLLVAFLAFRKKSIFF